MQDTNPTRKRRRSHWIAVMVGYWSYRDTIMSHLCQTITMMSMNNLNKLLWSVKTGWHNGKCYRCHCAPKEAMSFCGSVMCQTTTMTITSSCHSWPITRTSADNGRSWAPGTGTRWWWGRNSNSTPSASMSATSIATAGCSISVTNGGKFCIILFYSPDKWSIISLFP